VHVAGLIDLRHAEQLREIDLERLLDLARDLEAEFPRARIAFGAAHGAHALEEVLVGREP
jgi:hypothetical protein